MWPESKFTLSVLQQSGESLEPQVSRSGRLIKPKKFLDEGEDASRPPSAAAGTPSTPVPGRMHVIFF